MKKKIAALALSVCMAAALTGCGSKISNDNITVTKYKGLEVNKVENTKVTDEDVENSVQSSLEQNKTSTEVTDRAAQSGDVVTIDYTGKKDGVAFDGGTATDQKITIGAGGFIDGFEDGIVGHTIGETFDVALTFPEDYQNEELKGQPVVFTMTLKSIATESVPELSDEFVKKVSKESKTVEDYKKEIKKSLEDQNKQTSEDTLKQEVLAALAENTTVKKYPSEDVKKITDQLTEQYNQIAQYSGVTLEELLSQQMGMTEDEFNKKAKEVAKENVKQKLAIQLIAKKEKLEPSKDEYKTKMEEYAKEYGFTDLDSMLEQYDEEVVKEAILNDAVIQWLVDNCKQVEADTSSAK